MEDFDICDYHKCGNLAIKRAHVIGPKDHFAGPRFLREEYIAICPKHQFILNDYIWEPISRESYLIAQVINS